MHTLTACLALGYHGCTRPVAERLLAGEPFQPSQNDYDWLGPGIYFWEANPERALQFARESIARKGEQEQPCVVGAVIDMGLCLDATTQKGLEAIRLAWHLLDSVFKKSGIDLPRNTDHLKKLDCAVFKELHNIRQRHQEQPVDTVRGNFIEGPPLYPGATFHEKNHIQICVCNPARIRGVFQPALS